MTAATLPRDTTLGRHHGAVVESNARPGPGRGPAPEPGPERWWWLRWRMYDDLLHDALDALFPTDDVAIRVRVLWPDDWPDADSGLLSIRQMEWLRVTLIGGRQLDVKGRLFA